MRTADLKSHTKTQAMPKLKAIELFKHLPQADIKQLEALGVSNSFPKNKVLIKENEPANAMYFIDSGKVRVYVSDESGKQLTLNTLSTGEHFGELSLLDEDTRSASVITLEKSIITRISKDDFTQHLLSNPGIAPALLKSMAIRVRRLTDNIKIIALRDVYGRIRETLINLAITQDDKLIVTEKITQIELANRIGSSREMVAKILKDLQVGGYISIKNKQIEILKDLPKSY